MAINYIEKGYGLHEKIREAGHSIECKNGVFITSNDSAVQAIIDAYTASDAANIVKKAIRALADEKEDELLSAREQIEMLSRRLELQDIKETRTLTAAELTEIADIKTAMGKVKAVRDAKKVHITALNALASANDFAGILSYKIKQGWPAKGA